jgi:hypothetical protein
MLSNFVTLAGKAQEGGCSLAARRVTKAPFRRSDSGGGDALDAIARLDAEESVRVGLALGLGVVGVYRHELVDAALDGRDHDARDGSGLRGGAEAGERGEEGAAGHGQRKCTRT